MNIDLMILTYGVSDIHGSLDDSALKIKVHAYIGIDIGSILQFAFEVTKNLYGEVEYLTFDEELNWIMQSSLINEGFLSHVNLS